MRIHTLVLPLFMLVACPKSPSSVNQAQLLEYPRLPSPGAGSYARVPTTPKDNVIRAIIGERVWDESLAGTAAGLALDAAEGRGGFTRREIRSASWKAGYPWPILSIGHWSTVEADKPPKELITWVKEQPESRDIGVVRARAQGQDVWVAVSGQALIDLGVVDKEVQTGGTLRIPAHAGGTLHISNGVGFYERRSLDTPQTIYFDVPGEWLIQAVDQGGDLARFTVYVDETEALTPILPRRNAPVTSADEANERALTLLNLARREYSNKDFNIDLVLKGAVANVAKDGGSLTALADQSVGPEGSAVAGRCRARVLEDCIDQMIWDPKVRAGFVEGGDWLIGVHVDWHPNQVTVRTVMAKP